MSSQPDCVQAAGRHTEGPDGRLGDWNAGLAPVLQVPGVRCRAFCPRGYWIEIWLFLRLSAAPHPLFEEALCGRRPFLRQAPGPFLTLQAEAKRSAWNFSPSIRVRPASRPPQLQRPKLPGGEMAPLSRETSSTSLCRSWRTSSYSDLPIHGPCLHLGWRPRFSLRQAWKPFEPRSFRISCSSFAP